MESNRKAPWKRKNPKPSKERVALRPEFKAKAKMRAEAAGRKYPNLIDNMWASAEQSRLDVAEAKKKPR